MVDGKNPEPLEQVPAMIFVKITPLKTNMTTENKKYTSFLIGDGDTSSTRMVEVDGGSNPLNHWNKSWPSSKVHVQESPGRFFRVSAPPSFPSPRRCLGKAVPVAWLRLG